MEYYSAIKKESVAFMKTWADLAGIMLSKTNQRKTNTLWFRLYVETKKQSKWTNKNRNKLIDTKNKLMVDRWEGFCGIDGKGKGIRKYNTNWQL